MRPSDLDRQAAASSLGVGYARGLLSFETLNERLDVVHAARSIEQLQALVSDLRPAVRSPLQTLARALRALSNAARESLIAPRRASRLVVELPDDLAARAEVLIGRSSSCDVVLGDRTVSRRHVLLRRNAEGWAVIDLDSTNGTWVNGRPVTRGLARAGDAISFGAQRARL
jgi:pSer/pThr/pTyr-binding forkhead associated (FHA) protein